MRALLLVTRDQATRAHLPFLDGVEVIRVDTVHQAASLDAGDRGRDDVLIAFGPDIAAETAAGGNYRHILWKWPRIVLTHDLPDSLWAGAVQLGVQHVVQLPDGRDGLLRMLDDDPEVAAWARDR